jgi:hypothetical protein
MLTVLTWLWCQPNGRTTYKAEHVAIWADMVGRNLSMPHRLACVTDMPEGIPANVEIIRPPGEFEGMQTPTWRGGKPSCFRRLTMFRRDAADIFGKRFVSMDLDCVVGGSLDPLFRRRDDLVLYKGTSGARPYNGSMLMMTAGCRPKVYEAFDEAGAVTSGAMYRGSDQAWLAYSLGPNEKVWDEHDGVFWWGKSYHRQRREVTPRLLFFPGTPKPWDVAKVRIDPFITENYARSVARREAA